MNLSNHFKLREVIKSQTASRLGIDNSLPEKLVEDARLFAEKILEPVRAHFGVPFSPQSWYRCPELNKAVKGSPSSEHQYATAADIEISGVSNLELAKFIKDNLEFNQLILEFYTDEDPRSGWVHCSYAPFVNMGKVSRFDGKKWKIGLED